MFPLLGSALAAVGMWLLSLLEIGTPRWQYSIWMAVLGTGIGMVMPVLILAVQNSVSPADLGTATSANNYFRQIGGSVGAAVFGTLFAGRLSDALEDRLTPRAGAGCPIPTPSPRSSSTHSRRPRATCTSPHTPTPCRGSSSTSCR